MKSEIVSDCSIIENITPKRAIFQRLFVFFAMSDEDLPDFMRCTESGEFSELTKYGMIYHY